MPMLLALLVGPTASAQPYIVQATCEILGVSASVKSNDLPFARGKAMEQCIAKAVAAGGRPGCCFVHSDIAGERDRGLFEKNCLAFASSTMRSNRPTGGMADGEIPSGSGSGRTFELAQAAALQACERRAQQIGVPSGTCRAKTECR